LQLYRQRQTDHVLEHADPREVSVWKSVF
jgi:hypothetical protein